MTPLPKHRTRAELLADPGPALREVLCRRCGRWMTQQDDLRWNHTDDDTLGCLDPITLKPYEEAPRDEVRD